MNKPKNKKEKESNLYNIKVQFDLNYKGFKGKEIDGESQTVPDMNLTVRQILEKSTRGLEVPAKPLLYFDHVIPVITDITDAQNYKEVLVQQINEIDKLVENDLKEAEEKRKIQKEDVPDKPDSETGTD